MLIENHRIKNTGYIGTFLTNAVTVLPISSRVIASRVRYGDEKVHLGIRVTGIPVCFIILF